LPLFIDWPHSHVLRGAAFATAILQEFPIKMPFEQPPNSNISSSGEKSRKNFW
jgi:hypothetical protein